MPGYEGARYGLVWICDSGIRGPQTFDFLLTDVPAFGAKANANCLCPPDSETWHSDRYDQSDDREGGIGPRVAICCWPSRLRCHPGAGKANMLTRGMMFFLCVLNSICFDASTCDERMFLSLLMLSDANFVQLVWHDEDVFIWADVNTWLPVIRCILGHSSVAPTCLLRSQTSC